MKLSPPRGQDSDRTAPDADDCRQLAEAILACHWTRSTNARLPSKPEVWSENGYRGPSGPWAASRFVAEYGYGYG